jgi:O-antigen ligase
MRRAVLALATACVLAGATALAFFSGGYFAEPQLIAAIVVWALVVALAILGPAPLPRGTPGRIALAGLVLMTLWSALSLTWAPVAGPAQAAVQRLVLYVGALLLAIGVLRERRALRALEPALAGGATIVIGYGLAGRLLPGIVDLARSRSAGGRLEQPITYWNAEGALAAVGLVLCVRLAGDRSRPPIVRALAAAAIVPLGAGVYLSYSRGAIAVAALGIVTVAALARSRTQLRVSAVALAFAVVAAVAAAVFPGVASLEGSHRTRDGAIVLAILVVLAAAAAALAYRDRAPADDTLPAWGRRLGPVAAVIAVAVAAGLLVGGLSERPTQAELGAGAKARRLTTVSSNRYEYWRVALDTFADHPLAGEGAGGFRVAWLRHRKINEAVRDTHSLEFEMAAELGLVGLLALALAAGGVAAASRRALASHRALAAGPVAGVLAWFLHASIDWDWQLPGVSLPAIALAAGLIVLAEEPQPREGSGSSLRASASARGSRVSA